MPRALDGVRDVLVDELLRLAQTSAPRLAVDARRERILIHAPLRADARAGHRSGPHRQEVRALWACVAWMEIVDDDLSQPWQATIRWDGGPTTGGRVPVDRDDDDAIRQVACTAVADARSERHALS